MSEYYGVSPSSDFFMHYGVKGMKWGVRKALKKDNMLSLAYQYNRALNKKASLKEETSRKQAKENAKSYAAGAGLLLGAGALGGLASYGISKGQIAAQRALLPNYPYRTLVAPTGLIGASALSAGGGLAALGAAAKSAYHATKKGHKKQLARYANFSKEMNTTFNKKVKNKLRNYVRDHPEEFDVDGYSLLLEEMRRSRKREPKH